MTVLPSLATDKTFWRLLLATEKHVEENSIEDWKLDQFVKTLTEMLNNMRKSVNRPSSAQLDEYKQRIDILRKSIDLTKLEDQTFPRHVLQNISPNVPVKEQQNEVTTLPTPPIETEEIVNSSTKTSTRPNLNRQQQLIESEENKQDDIATSMSAITQNLLHTAKHLNKVVQSDKKKLAEAEFLIDTNTAKLSIQSKRLKHNAYNGSNCWIYLMIIIVIITFIYLTLFMRMFRKRTVTVKYTNPPSKSSLLNYSNNQTAINNTNITIITKPTDYISLLLNYASENHTDL